MDQGTAEHGLDAPAGGSSKRIWCLEGKFEAVESWTGHWLNSPNLLKLKSSQQSQSDRKSAEKKKHLLHDVFSHDDGEAFHSIDYHCNYDVARRAINHCILSMRHLPIYRKILDRIDKENSFFKSLLGPSRWSDSKCSALSGNARRI